eukprot:COSAG01_NODE_21928_length_873_cov_1.043590_1_plen_111_part_01
MSWKKRTDPARHQYVALTREQQQQQQEEQQEEEERAQHVERLRNELLAAAAQRPLAAETPSSGQQRTRLEQPAANCSDAEARPEASPRPTAASKQEASKARQMDSLEELLL